MYGEGNGNPLHYSCLKNSMDRGAWWLKSMESQRVRHDWVTHTLAIKKNEVESLLVRWMNLESVIQTEASQKEKDKYPILTTHVWTIEKRHWWIDSHGKNGNVNE